MLDNDENEQRQTLTNKNLLPTHCGTEDAVVPKLQTTHKALSGVE
jgi:hypothetical protein